MRLIDADKLPVFDMTDNIAGENGAKAIVTHWIQLDFITHAPTIEAIPVKWIRNYASHKASKDLIDCYWHFWEDDVLKMINVWEKENGKD